MVALRRVSLALAIAGLLAAALGLQASSAAAAPTLGLSATGTVVGGTIQATAQLSEAPGATGTISFAVFGPDDPTCSGPALTPAPADATVTGEGSYPSGAFAPPAAGAYSWTAHYSGDGVNPEADAACSESGQTSVVSKASPSLTAAATSAVKVGLPITDSATLAGGFAPDGALRFRAFGPGDPTCAGAPAYEADVPVAGDGTYAPPGFAPGPGIYLWTVEYEGDADNLAAAVACGAPGQASAVGVLDVTLAASATSASVGGALSATATLAGGATPRGQLTFRAFAPGDSACTGAAAFTANVPVAGNGTYGSPAFAAARVGTYRWTVSYDGDANHSPAGTACGTAASAVAKATPTLAGKVGKRLLVGTKFRDTVTLQGGFSPTGTITFAIYAPGAKQCAKPAFTNTVRVSGNGTYRSAPFAAKRAGSYRFLATYSGDAANQRATEPCASPTQLARVQKRTPALRALLDLTGPQQIAIRARLSRAASPTGRIAFRLYGPDDERCTGKPAFSGSLRIRANGAFPLAAYIATRPGTYRLTLTYSGDPRNRSARASCAASKPVTVAAAD